MFLENLAMYICNGYMPLFTCDNIWVQRLVLCQCLCVQFHSHFFLLEEMLQTKVKKIMDQHVISNLTSATIIFVSFDLYMFHDNVNIFVLVINE
jgi:hypothetical protein